MTPPGLGRAKLDKPARLRRYTRLVARDGEECFVCTAPPPLTIEHLLSLRYGGTNHLANLALVCEECNRYLDDKPVTEKMRIYAETFRRKS